MRLIWCQGPHGLKDGSLGVPIGGTWYFKLTWVLGKGKGKEGGPTKEKGK